MKNINYFKQVNDFTEIEELENHIRIAKEQGATHFNIAVFNTEGGREVSFVKKTIDPNKEKVDKVMEKFQGLIDDLYETFDNIINNEE